jgi:hypothetical protein
MQLAKPDPHLTRLTSEEGRDARSKPPKGSA